MQKKLESDKNLDEIVAKLRSHFQPIKIFLFGSRAVGTASEESDYDILVLLKSSDKSEADRMREASQVLWGRKYSVDVFVLTEDEFDQSKERHGSIANVVLTQGLEL